MEANILSSSGPSRTPALLRRRSAAASGIALVITLITLSILVVLLVGFAASMSLEQKAAHSFEDTQRAKMIAQGAVSHAVDLLRTNIPEPAQLSETEVTAPGEDWAVNPGRLTILKSNTTAKYIPLHTGEVTTPPDPSQPRDAVSVDLNAPLPGDTVPVITGTAAGTGSARPPMRVQWVNLLSDPTSNASATNRLVGRYAFWIDDECARVNFNTALGKPAATTGTKFGDQLNGNALTNPATPAVVTPLFDRGDSSVVYGGGSTRSWSLGRPQSVNLDLFFDDPSQLYADKLLSYTFLHGFARYPQAILDFINVSDPKAWLDQNRYNLTFYSRSPEFNTFGKSRYFTTYVPLSLEGGPAYQQPFIYDSSGAYTGDLSTDTTEILHMNSLYGTFGYTSAVTNDDTGTTMLGGNEMNQLQETMLFSYLRRANWPGYGNASFLTKYGEAELHQIALNILLMARMATSQLGTDLATFSRDWSYRSTSVNYYPDKTYYPGATPERFYWPIPINGKTVYMLPQMPGPYVTQVRLYANAVPASKKASTIANDNTAPPKNTASGLSAFSSPVYIQYYYEVEYYMNPTGPVVDISEFPIRTDYLETTAAGPLPSGSLTVASQYGPSSLGDTRAAQNWNAAANMAYLVIMPPVGTTLGPTGSSYNGTSVPNRRIVRSPIFTVGQQAKAGTPSTALPIINGTDYSSWTPQAFEAAKGSTVSLNIKFRPGMSTLEAPARPRQMIPLGVNSSDTLQATFTVGIQPTGNELAVLWQISDPRLSSDLLQWNANVQGPGATKDVVPSDNADIAAIAQAEADPARSKFRYIQRAPVGATIGGYPIDRGDEYETAGRTASPGYWSFIHTGMQGIPPSKPTTTPVSVPWRTLDLKDPASGQGILPDWLLLDLFGPTYPMVHDQWKIDSTLPDQFSTPSYMNSTAGQVNLNSRIYPQNNYFKAPPRTQPLTAVFKNLRSDSDVSSLVQSIGNYQNDTTVFNYVGELSNVPGYAGSGNPTPWQQESLLRNMAGCLTTKSNTFGVWGVAQSVKKSAKNANNGAFETGDTVLAEKRFYALVERYVWPGRDGVPGNGHLNGSGIWDRLAVQRATISTTGGITDTLFQLPGSPPLFRNAGQTQLQLDADATNIGTYPPFDGPQQVGMDPYAAAALGKITWTRSSLEDAYNPPQAAIKYRVVYFKYLDQ